MLLDALHTTGDALNLTRCWLHRKSFHFILDGDWSIAIAPDTADRLRVEVFHGLNRVAGLTRWVLAGDTDRLIEVVNDLAGEVNGDMQPVR